MICSGWLQRCDFHSGHRLQGVLRRAEAVISGTYHEIRPHVADGDLVAVRSRHGVFPNLTRLITGSPYTHTAIALWIEGGLWIAEMRSGGNVLVPLSQRANEDFDVFDCPVDRRHLRGQVLGLLRTKIDYDVGDSRASPLIGCSAFRCLSRTTTCSCAAPSQRLCI